MGTEPKKKEFIIIKKGLHYFLLKTSDIAYIYMENDITYIIDQGGARYVCFENLNSLEAKLDDCFFRANRQYIVNVDFIKSFRMHEKSKIIVEMKVNESKNTIHVSQVTAPKFKEWILKF
ncbi:MAG TPA: LytTR family DNA-binding domain-containing protein [Flavisolibacter sp.]|nr:LytTR family DNA-binding domain-containing protein [Flavisolibacter sp.]